MASTCQSLVVKVVTDLLFVSSTPSLWIWESHVSCNQSRIFSAPSGDWPWMCLKFNCQSASSSVFNPITGVKLNLVWNPYTKIESKTMKVCHVSFLVNVFTFKHKIFLNSFEGKRELEVSLSIRYLWNNQFLWDFHGALSIECGDNYLTAFKLHTKLSSKSELWYTQK